MSFDENDFARMIERTGGDDNPRPGHQEQLRRQMLEVYDRARAGTRGAAFITSLLNHGRRIMRHPISRVAAAAIFLLALGAVALQFHGGGATPALADFLQPILDAKSARFKVLVEAEGQPPEKSETMVVPNRVRREVEGPGKPGRYTIVTDYVRGKHLFLFPATRRAAVHNMSDRSRDKLPKDFFLELRSQLLNARHASEFKRDPLGEKEIDGRRVLGYRLSGHGGVIDLWGDPETSLPIRVEMRWPTAMILNMKMTMSDFAFDVDLDESLFSIEPPPGYTMLNGKVNFSSGDEKDLVETFRCFSRLSGGAFPDTLSLTTFVQLVEKHRTKSSAKGDKKPNQQETPGRTEEELKAVRAWEFADGLTPQSDAHYAGKGVSLGKADTPIFWYRPKDAKRYRVIYADLSVRDADAAPSVPNAQPVPAPSGPKE
jgi:outer membrane lipoprotein-sorting protein